MQMKIKKYIFNGFGFPVELHNVPAREIRGSIEPIINYKSLAAKVISEICSDENTNPLTGRQVFFLRNHLRMTLREFGKLLEVTHPVIKQWEKCDDKSTKMSDSTEKILRLKMLESIGTKPARFMEAFQNLYIDRENEANHSLPRISL
jgi:DNA-binding transcriptional regulator YiaG